MPIIENKQVYDHSKSDLPKLTKELGKAQKAVDKLSDSSEDLAKALALVKKSNDGTEAEKLAKGTDKLRKATIKLKKAKTAEQIAAEKLVKAHKRLNQAYTPQAKALELVRQQTLQQNKALREQAKATLGVKNKTNGLIGAFKSMGKQLVGALGITAGIGLLVNQFNKMSQRSKELNKLTRELKGTFDITTREAKKLSSQINAIANNFEDADPKNLQISLTAIVKTFKDLSEQEALDLILEGFQKGSNNSGEFLDILKEYPGFFAKAGVSAQEMFAIINQQVKEGVYSDKGVDAIKEATISLTENTKIVKDALRPLGESINLQIRQKVEAGKAFEAMQLISKEMETLGVNSAEAQTIMADVFKGAGEDSDAFVRNLHNLNLSLDDVAEQTSIVSRANLKLSESYNNFITTVSDGSGVISTAMSETTLWFSELFDTLTSINKVDFANKLKIAANSLVEFIDLISLGAVSDFSDKLKELGVDVNGFKFGIEQTTEALKLQNNQQKVTVRLTKEQKAALEEETEALKKEKEALKKAAAEAEKLAAEEKKLNEEWAKLTPIQQRIKLLQDEEKAIKDTKDEIELLDKLLKDRRGRETGLVDPIETKKAIKVVLTDIQKFEDDKALIEDNARAKKKKKEEEDRKEAAATAEDWNDARLKIIEQFETSAVQLASDIFTSFQDEKLAKINSDAEAQKAILQQRLDDGVISEQQFAGKVAAIEQEQRIASAKAEKKKALFDLALATALAIAKAGFITPAAIAIAIVGAIQAAAIAAKPLPLNKGLVKVPGQGNTDRVNTILTPGESVINKVATAKSEGILNAVNDGILTDKNAGKLLSKEGELLRKEGESMLLLSAMMQNNDTSKQLLQAMLNMGYVVPGIDQFTHHKADGSQKILPLK